MNIDEPAIAKLHAEIEATHPEFYKSYERVAPICAACASKIDAEVIDTGIDDQVCFGCLAQTALVLVRPCR